MPSCERHGALVELDSTITAICLGKADLRAIAATCRRAAADDAEGRVSIRLEAPWPATLIERAILQQVGTGNRTRRRWKLRSCWQGRRRRSGGLRRRSRYTICVRPNIIAYPLRPRSSAEVR